MAPSVKLHFFAANDVNGDLLHEVTDEDDYFKSLKLKVERDGLGGAELLLARTVGFSPFATGTFRAESFVRLIIPAYSSTTYYPWGFFLNKRQQVVVHVDEKGGEEFKLGGPGPKQYLARHALGIEQQTGTGANIDLENGVWRWNEHATVGRILDRIIQEDAALNNPSLPDLTYTFDNIDDSDGVNWIDDDIAGPGEFEIPIGTDLLKILWDLDDFVQLTSWVDLGTVASPKFELNIIQGLGDDNTGSAFGAGVCLLKEGVNVADDAVTVEGASLRQASHVLVEGKDGVWVQAVRTGYSPGDYTKRERISFTRTRNEAWLEAVGKRWLDRQDNGEKEITIEIVPGQSDAAGSYFPAPDRVLWLSNLISVETAADGTSQTALDLDPSDAQLVTGFELDTHQAADDANSTALARSWDVKVKLNVERSGNVQKTPDQKSTASGGGSSCKCIKLCDAQALVIHVDGTDDLEFGYIDPVSSAQVQLYRRSVDGEATPIVLTSPAHALTTDLTYYIEDHTIAGVKLDTDTSSGDYTAVLITDQDNGYSLYEWDDLNTGLNRNDLHVLIPNDRSSHAAPCVHTHPELFTLTETVAAQDHSAFDDGLIGDRFLIGAHGGDIGNNGDSGDSWPQNSLQAHRQAALKGADYSDVDCRLTSDGVWVAYHDTSITAGTNGTGNVDAITAAAFTAAEFDSTAVPGYNASRHGSTVSLVTVQAIIDAVRPYGMNLQLELKPTDDAAATSLAELVVTNGFEERVYIHCTSAGQSIAVKAVSPRIQVGRNYPDLPDANADIFSIAHASVASLATITAQAPLIPSSNMPIADFGGDEAVIIRNMFDRGIRMWTSNYLTPALMLRDELLNNESVVGWAPLVYPVGYSTAVALTTAEALAANGGSLAIGFMVPSRMRFAEVSLRNTDASLARTWGWDLYVQDFNHADSEQNTLRRVANSTANETFTAAAASTRTIAAAVVTTLQPGFYWLVIQNRHATNTFGVGYTLSSNDFGPNLPTQIKTTTNPNGATLDFVAATWTKSRRLYAAYLRGHVFGQSATW